VALNKPKFTLFKNTTYALAGLKDIVLHETSFKMQMLLFVVMCSVAWYLPVSHTHSMILSISLFIPIMAEIANSAIERVVDLVTMEYHDLAKCAKDAGAALVFVSLFMTGVVWLAVLADAYELI